MRAARHLDLAFAALSDPTRRAVVALLRERPLRSSDMADVLSATRPSMSRHLRVLRRARLVEECPIEEDARVRMYRLRPNRFAELREWLDEVAASWDRQLGAFKKHAEARHGAR